MSILSSLHRAKAARNELDLFVIFVKMASSFSRIRSNIYIGTMTFVKSETLTSFFSQTIQGDLSERIAKTFGGTYMGERHQPREALPSKHSFSLAKSRAAKTMLHLFRISFSRHLLPFNYAFGVNGGMGFIIITVSMLRRGEVYHNEG